MKKILKNTFAIFGAVVLCGACADDANEFGRIDQKFDAPIPSPVTVTSVRSISGGAVIKVNIPDDDNIKGVVATYFRGDEEVNTKISRYVDSLTVVGFSDTKTRKVRIASFNANEETSEEVSVDVTPLAPAIEVTTPTLIQTFGGVKIRIKGNSPKADLAVVLLRDGDLNDVSKPVKDMKWEHLTTLFTAAEEITLTRRNIDPVEAIFGCYLRDRWGNVSDTVATVITPLKEERLNKDKFTDAKLADDNAPAVNLGNICVENLWDGLGQDEKTSSGGNLYHIYASERNLVLPIWLTIDLGVKVKLSHIQTLPRIGYMVWQGAQVREFEFWGSMAPTGQVVDGNEHGFDDSWFCLGKFEQVKPSGYDPDGSVGTVTNDDIAYFNAGNDFELNNEEYPRAYDEVRYLRIVFVSNFSSYGVPGLQTEVHLGEVTPYGQVIQEYR